MHLMELFAWLTWRFDTQKLRLFPKHTVFCHLRICLEVSVSKEQRVYNKTDYTVICVCTNVTLTFWRRIFFKF